MKDALVSAWAEGRRGLTALVLAAALLGGVTMSESGLAEARSEQAPEFPSQDPRQWIGPPQTIKGLTGKVVILDVWTFG